MATNAAAATAPAAATPVARIGQRALGQEARRSTGEPERRGDHRDRWN